MFAQQLIPTDNKAHFVTPNKHNNIQLLKYKQHFYLTPELRSKERRMQEKKIKFKLANIDVRHGLGKGEERGGDEKLRTENKRRSN